MEIVDISNNKINACFRFTVRNSEISVSTMFNADRAEICIFEGDKCVKDKLGSIQQAIDWVFSFGDRG